jgi:hypothetical protein
MPLACLTSWFHSASPRFGSPGGNGWVRSEPTAVKDGIGAGAGPAACQFRMNSTKFSISSGRMGPPKSWDQAGMASAYTSSER